MRGGLVTASLGAALLTHAVTCRITADRSAPGANDAMALTAISVLGTCRAEKRFAEQGTVIVASPPDEFARFFKAELAKWARVVKETGIKAE